MNKKWKLPESTEAVDKLFEPGSGPHIIYKHSFSCGISVFAKSRIEGLVEELSSKAAFYFIDVHENRNLSNYVAEKSGVRHESPQLIILFNGEVYWHASHNEVNPAPVKEAVDELVA